MTAASPRMVDGATFLENHDTDTAAVWGSDDLVLWAQGESLLIVGPDGVGKTTVAQQLCLARCGLRDDFLGMPVEPARRRVLYIAADRPKQAQRSLRRMVTEHDMFRLAERLQVWKGPPEVDVAKNPDTLREMAYAADADTLFLDSLKDFAFGLSSDDVGAAFNSAIQRCLADNIEVVGLHHPRKPSEGNRRPNTLSDVYGSRWLTAGSGSVLMLWGQAGDNLVEAAHLKQPVEPVGPWKLLHDHQAGATTVAESVDPLRLLRLSVGGLIARDLAAAVNNTPTPDRNQIERARRQLDRLVRHDLAIRKDGIKGGVDGGAAARYYPAVTDHGTDHAPRNG